MMNWIKFFVAFLFVLTAVIFVTVFYHANKPIAFAMQTASDRAIQSGQLISVDHVQSYNGMTQTVTVFGENGEGEKIAVFVDEESVGPYEEVLMANGISADEAEAAVRKELNVNRILHITLGIEDDHPVWEVAFINEIDRLNYVYVYFDDGQWWKRILNL
jgi:uncharacterized protein YpmB